MKTTNILILLLLLLIGICWFQCSRDQTIPIETTRKNVETTRHRNEIENMRDVNGSESHSAATEEAGFEATAIVPGALTIDVEPGLLEDTSKLWINPVQFGSSLGPNYNGTLYEGARIAVFRSGAVRNLDFFVIREYSSKEEQLLKMIVREVMKEHQIDVLLSGEENLSDSEEPVVMWYDDRIDITEQVIQEFLKQVK